MTKITLKEFVALINNTTKTAKKSIFRICEYNYNIFSVEIDKKSVIYLDASKENKYDILFETLKKEFDERYQLIWSHDICGNYEAFMIIDGKVTIDFNYGLSEGQNWLYLHEE